MHPLRQALVLLKLPVPAEVTAAPDGKHFPPKLWHGAQPKRPHGQDLGLQFVDCSASGWVQALCELGILFVFEEQGYSCLARGEFWKAFKSVYKLGLEFSYHACPNRSLSVCIVLSCYREGLKCDLNFRLLCFTGCSTNPSLAIEATEGSTLEYSIPSKSRRATREPPGPQSRGI